MKDRIETEISKCYVKSTLKEFDQRTGEGMIGNLSRELADLKKERDIRIMKAIEEINSDYEERFNRINKKILAKAKLLEK